jgi:hypothetical protein
MMPFQPPFNPSYGSEGEDSAANWNQLQVVTASLLEGHRAADGLGPRDLGEIEAILSARVGNVFSPSLLR